MFKKYLLLTTATLILSACHGDLSGMTQRDIYNRAVAYHNAKKYFQARAWYEISSYHTPYLFLRQTYDHWGECLNCPDEMEKKLEVSRWTSASRSQVNQHLSSEEEYLAAKMGRRCVITGNCKPIRDYGSTLDN